MAPAAAIRVFGLREHAVEDHEIRVADEGGKARIGPGIAVLHVADVADAAAPMAQAKPGGATRMVQEMGFDPCSVVERDRLARPEAVILETGRKLAEADRKQRRREEPPQGLHGALAVQMAAIGADHALPGEQGRLEERKAADVVEMEVAEEDVDLFGGILPEFAAQGGEAGSRIENEETLAASDLDTRRVRPEFDELRTGCAGRASNAPEPDLQRLRRCNTPYHVRIMIDRKPRSCALAHINKLLLRRPAGQEHR